MSQSAFLDTYVQYLIITLSLILFPNSRNVLASSENFCSSASCWSVRVGLPLVPVKTSSKSANPLKPDVESDHVVVPSSHPVVSWPLSPPVISHTVSPINPVVSSIFSMPPVSAVFSVPHQNEDNTFVIRLPVSIGYMVLST